MARKKRKKKQEEPVDLIYYTWKGILCSRRKNKNPKNPRTPAQMNHRKRIGRSSRFIKACKKMIQVGYQETSMDNPFNEARQYFYKNCFVDSEDGNPTMVYKNIKVSRGKLPKPEDFRIEVEESQATAYWKIPVKLDGTNELDNAIIQMFSDVGEDGLAMHYRNIAKRQEGKASFQILRSEQPVHVWMFFNNQPAVGGESRDYVSDSVYLGEF